MDKQDIIAKINEVLADEFEVEQHIITPEENIKKTLQLDSLGIVDMVALIEVTFGISLKNSEIANIQTFSALYNFVYKRITWWQKLEEKL